MIAYLLSGMGFELSASGPLLHFVAVFDGRVADGIAKANFRIWEIAKYSKPI